MKVSEERYEMTLRDDLNAGTSRVMHHTAPFYSKALKVTLTIELLLVLVNKSKQTQELRLG